MTDPTFTHDVFLKPKAKVKSPSCVPQLSTTNPQPVELLDADLAMLYGVETKALNRAVKRNPSRFPQDFMLQLTAEEAAILKCQTGTSSSGYGGRRYLPYAFTEQGVAMLSSVLRSVLGIERQMDMMSRIRRIFRDCRLAFSILSILLILS